MIKRYLATKPMVARDHQQHHRVATPLELYFDLVFVIAIAATQAVCITHSPPITYCKGWQLSLFASSPCGGRG